MSLWSFKKKPIYAPSSVASTSGWIDPSTQEVLVAMNGLVAAAAIAAPTFTETMTPASGNVVTGGTITVNITANKAVDVGSGLPTIKLTIGANTRYAVYDPITSTNTALKFKYVVVAGDLAASQIVVEGIINGAIGYNVGVGLEPVSTAEKVFTPVATGVTVN